MNRYNPEQRITDLYEFLIDIKRLTDKPEPVSEPLTPYLKKHNVANETIGIIRGLKIIESSSDARSKYLYKWVAKEDISREMAAHIYDMGKKIAIKGKSGVKLKEAEELRKVFYMPNMSNFRVQAMAQPGYTPPVRKERESKGEPKGEKKPEKTLPVPAIMNKDSVVYSNFMQKVEGTLAFLNEIKPLLNRQVPGIVHLSNYVQKHRIANETVPTLHEMGILKAEPSYGKSVYSWAHPELVPTREFAEYIYDNVKIYQQIRFAKRKNLAINKQVDVYVPNKPLKTDLEPVAPQPVAQPEPVAVAIQPVAQQALVVSEPKLNPGDALELSMMEKELLKLVLADVQYPDLIPFATRLLQKLESR